MQAIILAAGRGTRMRSETPKPLHLLAGKPFISHIFDALLELDISDPIVVVGHKKEEVMRAVSTFQPNAQFVIQTETLGTGHAVKTALPILNDTEPTLILVGDRPLYTSVTLRALADEHLNQKAVFSMTVATLEDHTTHGRVARDKTGQVTAIVEYKELTPETAHIREVNLGAYLADPIWLKKVVPTITQQPNSGEYALLEIVAMASQANLPIATLDLVDIDESMGIDTPEDLLHAEEIFHKRILNN